MSLLRKLKNNDIPTLRNFLNTKLHSSISMLQLIDVKEKFNFPMSILVSEDDPTKFIFIKNIVHNPKSFNIFWDTERVCDDELQQYLLSVPEWDWNEEFLSFSIETSLAFKLDSVLRRGVVSSETLKKSYSGQYIIFQITKDKLTRKSLPDGFTFGTLKDFHVPYMFSVWKYSKGQTIENFQKYLTIFPNTAIFMKEDIEQRRPVSWVLYYNYGFMGQIYTETKYRRLGLASAALCNLSAKLMKENILTLTQVEPDNEESLKMHKNLGFQIISEVYYSIYKPETN